MCLPKPTTSNSSSTPFASGRAYALGITVALLMNIALNLIAVASDHAQIDLISRIRGGQTVTQAEAAANDSQQQAIVTSQLLVFLPTGILFLMWIHRAHRNLPALGARGLRFSPGMAVGWFFVPILNLFRPYQVVKEIWKASDPNVDTWDAFSWQSAAGSPVIKWWWILGLTANAGGRAAFYLASRTQTVEELWTASWVILVANVLNVIPTLLAIVIVRTINARQERKNAHLATLTTPQVVEPLPTPQMAEAHYERGLLAYGQDDYDHALADFDEAIRLKPDYAEAYVSRGLVYYYTSDYERAIADLDQAITSNPQEAEAYFLRGKWYTEIDEREKAMSDLEKALELSLEPPSRNRSVKALLEKLKQ